MGEKKVEVPTKQYVVIVDTLARFNGEAGVYERGEVVDLTDAQAAKCVNQIDALVNAGNDAARQQALAKAIEDEVRAKLRDEIEAEVRKEIADEAEAAKADAEKASKPVKK